MDNLEIVRSLYESFARRDHEFAFTLYDPEIEWDASEFGLVGFGTVFHGHAGVRRFWRAWLEAWEDLEFEVEDVFDAGDCVVAFVHQRNHGKESGIWIDQKPYAQIWTLEDGKVVRMRMTYNREEALNWAKEQGSA